MKYIKKYDSDFKKYLKGIIDKYKIRTRKCKSIYYTTDFQSITFNNVSKDMMKDIFEEVGIQNFF